MPRCDGEDRLATFVNPQLKAIVYSVPGSVMPLLTAYVSLRAN